MSAIDKIAAERKRKRKLRREPLIHASTGVAGRIYIFRPRCGAVTGWISFERRDWTCLKCKRLYRGESTQ